MSDRGVLVFAYDGSFEGLMCAVFDAFSMKTLPDDIFPFDDMEPTLLKIHTVETDFEHAKRVEHAIEKTLGKGAASLVRRGFLYDGGGKEAAIMRYLWKGFNEGARAVSAIGDPDVNPLFKMATAVSNEQRMFFGFVRFAESGGALTAVIHPKHYVLPLLRGYFCARMYNENFMIYDENHGAALIHSGRRTAIIPVADLELPKCEEDKFYRDLWKSYYRHIAIASRYNPKCRMTHMPKRFWADMPEVAEELESSFEQRLSLGTAEEIKTALAEEKQRRLEDGSAPVRKIHVLKSSGASLP